MWALWGDEGDEGWGSVGAWGGDGVKGDVSVRGWSVCGRRGEEVEGCSVGGLKVVGAKVRAIGVAGRGV